MPGLGSLDGRRVLVTGASSGIGADLAVRLAGAGATVAVAARRADRLDEVVDQCQQAAGAAVALPVDLSDLKATDRMVTEVLEQLGGLDAVVNNAAAPKRRAVTELTFDEVERTTRLNYFSPVRIMLAVLPRMLEQGHGSIVNVASTAGRVGAPHEGVYGGTKAALTLFSECMAIDLHDEPVEVHVVHPGPIDTEIWDVPGENPSPWAGEKFPPSDVSDVIERMLVEGAPFEAYVPDDYKHLLPARSNDPESWIAGAAAFAATAD